MAQTVIGKERRMGLSPRAKKIVREKEDAEADISHMIEEEAKAGHFDKVNYLQADLVYERAKADVNLNHTMHEERMNPKLFDGIEDIVTYHWDKRKKQIQHNKTVHMMNPVDSTDLEEIENQISRRKRVIQEGTAFYNAIDGIDEISPYIYKKTDQSDNVSRILADLSMSRDESRIAEMANKRLNTITEASAGIENDVTP